jgi:hypothetical protein
MTGRRAAAAVTDPATGRVRVLRPACTTCIYGGNSPVSAARRDQVTRANLEADALLTCHATLPGNPGRAPPAVCHGYWIRHWRDTICGRLACAFLGITYVTPPPHD